MIVPLRFLYDLAESIQQHHVEENYNGSHMRFYAAGQLSLVQIIDLTKNCPPTREIKTTWLTVWFTKSDLKQSRQERHKFAYLTTKKFFCTLCTCSFHILLIRELKQQRRQRQPQRKRHLKINVWEMVTIL